ncbi:MAG: hypothetical protein J7M40_06710, partial [Planctomycetes bacterium]|nr:hypothetical protein [Planctomycetota bacterium]
MLSRRSIRRTGKWKAYIVIVFILAFFVIADSGPLAEDTGPRVLRSRVYRIQSALSKDVKGQLESLGIGTKIDLLGQDILIVTAADGADLIAASSLIDLIDSGRKYAVKVLADYSESDTLPTTQQIADSIGIAGVGSFAEPPAANGDDRVIVDVRNSKVIAVAPVSLLDRLSASVANLMADSKADDAQLTEDAEQTPPVADDTAESKSETQPQAREVADVEPEATAADKPQSDDFFQAEMFASLAKAETDVQPQAPQVADVEPETTAADKPESDDFFQAEMFASLAEAETDAKIAEAERKANEALARAIKAEEVAREKERLAAEAKAKADLAEIAEAKRQADEALARANKAEEVAREKERLAAEAVRRAAEAEKRAAKAQEAVPPAQSVKKTPPAQQKTETPPKTEAAGKAPPKAAVKAEDKTPPKT